MVVALFTEPNKIENEIPSFEVDRSLKLDSILLAPISLLTIPSGSA